MKKLLVWKVLEGNEKLLVLTPPYSPTYKKYEEILVNVTVLVLYVLYSRSMKTIPPNLLSANFHTYYLLFLLQLFLTQFSSLSLQSLLLQASVTFLFLVSIPNFYWSFFKHCSGQLLSKDQATENSPSNVLLCFG